jgi:hypothetical protein
MKIRLAKKNYTYVMHGTLGFLVAIELEVIPVKNT